jgi:hypothetical protein
VRRSIAITAITVLAASAAWAGESSRSFTSTTKSDEVTEVVLRGGVGDIEIYGVGGDTVEVSATATAKRSGFWGSARTRKALDEIRLTSEVRGSTLYLSLELPDEDDDDREIGEEWTVRMPASLALHVKFGVGDLKVIDVGGDVTIDFGVGDIRVEGNWADFGTIDASCGVGDIDLRSPKGRDDGSGFISRSLRSRGPGDSEIDIRAGVGDVTIKLR